MKVETHRALPDEVLRSLCRPSAFTLVDLGLSEEELRLDWHHGPVAVDLLFETFGPGFIEQAFDVMLESYDELEWSELLAEAKRVVNQGRFATIEDVSPVAVIIHEDGFELTTYPTMLLVAKHLGMPTVPIFMARADSVAPESWELQHILS